MSTTQVKSHINWQRGWKTYVWPCVLGESEKLVSIYETLYTVLRIVDSEVVPTIPFVYELIRVMKENLIRLNAKEWVLEIIVDHWDRTLKHPLHAIGN